MGLAGWAGAGLLAALAVAERAGLPGVTAWTLGCLVLAVAAAAIVAGSRTADEPLFLGRTRAVRAVPGGLLLGVITAGACFQLLRPASSQDLVAMALGATAGIAFSHGVARLRRGSSLLAGEAGGTQEGAPSLIQGVLLAAAGCLLAATALPAARDAVAGMSGLGGALSLALVLAVPAAAVAAGGLRGLLALAAALGLILAAGLVLSLWLGLTQLGALPLPGFSQPETLLGIAGARSRLFQADALPFIVAWLPLEGWPGLVFSLPFLAAAVVAALVARAVSPGIALDRRPVVVAAAGAQALVLLGLAAMAGYAVEAAGLQFVGASLQTPPPGLLEASRQGLATFCGARPETLDELRAACGLAPRALGQLALERIRLSDAFLWAGTPVALGVPSALAAPARLGQVVFPLLGLAAGLWLMAVGLGRGVFGRGRIAPGLASHRLGLLRLAALASACGLAGLAFLGPGGPGLWPPAVVLAGLALGLDIVQQGLAPPPKLTQAADGVQRAATPRRRAAPRTTAHKA
jgi:hypothetical protein